MRMLAKPTYAGDLNTNKRKLRRRHEYKFERILTYADNLNTYWRNLS